MATYATLTVNAQDIIGADFDRSRASVWIETNTEHGLIIVDGTTIRVGGRREQPDINGEVTFTNLVTTNSADNPTSFGYRVHITYVPKGSRKQGHDVLTTSDFPLTANANLAAISAAWDNITIPVNWQSDFLDQAQALLDAQVAIAGPVDGTVEALVKNTGGVGPLTSAALNATYARKAYQPINVAEDYGRNNTAVRAALAAGVASNRELYFSSGTFTITGDLVIATNGMTMTGDGDRTLLDFTGGGIVYDGSAGFLTELALHNLSIRRTGTAGAALRLKGGGGASTGVAHFNANNVRVRSSTGEGLLIDGAYIGTFTGCYWSGCVTGVKIAADSGIGNVYGNNYTFLGGETVTCQNAIVMTNPFGVSFIGHAIEGSTVSGVEIKGGAYAVVFDNCYVEDNAGFDFKIGTTTNCYNVAIRGGYFADALPVRKTHSIIVNRGQALRFEDISFAGYAGVPISIQEAFADTVWGRVDNCLRDGSQTGVVTYGTATQFDRLFIRDSSTPISNHLTGVGTLDFPSIAPGATNGQSFTVTGAAVGDDVTAHPDGAPESGLVWSALVTAANTVQVRASNISGAAIDPVVRNWRVRIWR